MNLAEDVSRTKRPTRQRNDDDVAGPFQGMNRVAAGPRAEASKRIQEAKNYKVKNRDDRPLFHALKMQTALAPMGYGARTALKDKLDKIETFDELGLRKDVLDAVATQALPYLHTLTPSPAQKLAVPALLSKKGEFEKLKKGKENEYEKYLLAAETGSGKTLAYLLPIIHQIKEAEEKEKAEKADRAQRKAEEQAKKQPSQIFEVEPPPLSNRINPDSPVGRPRALILLPTSELVEQVGKVAKALSHTVKFRSAAVSSSNSATVIKNRVFNPSGIDMIISTPHLLGSITEKEPMLLSKVNYIVADEADSLFDRSFRDTTLNLIDRSAPSLKQLILCSATIPKSLDTFIDKRFPMMKRLVTPKLHSIPRRVALGVVDIDKQPYNGNRTLACADVIWQLGKSGHEDDEPHQTIKYIIVFVNERDQAIELTEFLKTKGVDASALTRDNIEVRRGNVLEGFTSPTRVAGESKDTDKTQKEDYIPFEKEQQLINSPPVENPSRRKLADTKVLVTTDLGSRGIDTLAVRHAILYDVPHTTIDFVHRLGRLGRMNRRGRGVVLVGKKDRKDIVREVRDAMYRGQALI